jgi:hypothetical protein
MKLKWTFFIGLSVFLLLPKSALTQVPSIPKCIAHAAIEDTASSLEVLGDYYKCGQWGKLQNKIECLLGECLWKNCDDPNSTVPEYKFDEENNYYFVVFLYKGFDGETNIVRFLWHKPYPEPYVNRLPGVSKLYEIILNYEEMGVQFQTAYLSLRKENPIIAQIPKMAKLFEPLLLVKAPSGIEAPGAARGKTKKICVEVREVTLPYKRASIQIKDTVMAKNTSRVKDLNDAFTKLRSSLSKRESYGNQFGNKLIENLMNNISKVECSDEDEYSDKYTAAIKSAYERSIDESKKDTASIKPEDLKLGIFIEQQFIELIKQNASEKLSSEVEINNVPYERISFGLISSFMLSKNYNCDNRVKISDAGMYVNDPLKNPLTAAIINWHPFKYDPEAAKISWKERFRLFFGEVLTPEIGLCAGAGIAIIRGLTINTGAALLAINSPKNPIPVLEEGKEIGTKPQNKNDPFVMKGGWVFFIGFGYSFQ